MRVAFVGQSTFFEACALASGATRLHTTFLEFRAGADGDLLLRRLRAFAPDVVVVFRPEIIPPRLFAGVEAPTLGFLTEPLPRRGGRGVAHEDLRRRLEDLAAVDRTNFDRVVAFDPHIAVTADDVLPVWRSVPLPVADRYFRPVADDRVRPRPLFVGRSTEHRERWLVGLKHNFDLMHVAFGVGAAELEGLLHAFDVGINLHNEPYPSFENRVCLHLAAAHLVLTEPLDPLHGLEPGIDLLFVRSAEELEQLVSALHRHPTAWHAVRVRGRRKAEQYRASRVWPRLVGDLLRDVAARGGRHATAGR